MAGWWQIAEARHLPGRKGLQGRESNPRPPGYEPGELPLLHLAIDSLVLRHDDGSGRQRITRIRINV